MLSVSGLLNLYVHASYINAGKLLLLNHPVYIIVITALYIKMMMR